MEYMRVDKPWKESIENGNIEQALKRIEYQIAMNLLMIHNHFSDKELSSPVDVYNAFEYGHNVNGDVISDMQVFKPFSSRLYGVKCLLDSDFSDAKSSAMDDYIEIEKDLIAEMKKFNINGYNKNSSHLKKDDL